MRGLPASTPRAWWSPERHGPKTSNEKGAGSMSHTAQRTVFTRADIEAHAPAMKIGVLATVSENGLPHMTLLSSLRASSPTRLTFGQFTEGFSKTNVRR